MSLRPMGGRLAAAALALAIVAAVPAEAETYETPEAAVAALVAAVEAGDLDALTAVFGPESEDLVSTGVEEADRRRWADFSDAFREASRLVVDEDQAELFIGRGQWPFPVVLRNGADGWSFDVAGAREEVLARRVGRGELSAIAVARSFVRAQFEYFSRDRDGDGVLEFAGRLVSTPGERDGLYWPAEADEPSSPFDAEIAAASAAGYSYAAGGDAQPEPYEGYWFRVLDRQGPNAPGGAFDYAINGNMVAGFGLIAIPAEYGSSGIMTFLLGRDGVLYERDLGTATASIAAEIVSFDPTPAWTPVQGEGED